MPGETKSIVRLSVQILLASLVASHCSAASATTAGEQANGFSRPRLFQKTGCRDNRRSGLGGKQRFSENL